MSSEIVVDAPPKNAKRVSGGSTQPLSPEFSKWLERQFRGGETPQSIDAYPLFKGRDREQRLYHHDLRADETVNTEHAVELANEIFSDCQLHCDSLPNSALTRDGEKIYEVSVIDDRRGGLAKPVGTHLLKLMPRIHKPALSEEDINDISSEDSENLISRKMIIETFKEISGRTERNQQTTAVVVGEVMMLQKDSLKDSFEMIRDLLHDNRAMMGEFRELIKQVGQRSVEEKAVAIDAANAEVEREARRAVLLKETMWTNVMQAGMLEGVKVLGHLFPGFGQLFSALIQGKPAPPPPQLPQNGTNGTPTPGQPQLPAPTLNEKQLIDRFIEVAEKDKFDEHSTRGEKLFGKDDAQGKPIEAGVFTREQVAILTGVHMGSLGIDALDALLPESGKPEALNGIQIAKAMAYLTPAMVADISKVLEMRKAAKEQK